MPTWRFLVMTLSYEHEGKVHFITKDTCVCTEDPQQEDASQRYANFRGYLSVHHIPHEVHHDSIHTIFYSDQVN